MRPFLCVIGQHVEIRRTERARSPGGNVVELDRSWCDRCGWAIYGVGPHARWQPYSAPPVGGSGVKHKGTAA